MTRPLKIGILGGGIAGSTIALRLAEMGLSRDAAESNVQITLLEKGPSLVNGPPFCHLHAGGNLYREISDDQCLQLLKESIDTVKFYRQGINWRPTLIAIPADHPSHPTELLPRLQLLRNAYAKLVQEDETNAVLGAPQDYFRSYSYSDLKTLAKAPLPTEVRNLDDWMIPVAKQLHLTQIKYPLFLVQEYGLSAFRFAALATMAMEKLPHCQVHFHHQAEDVQSTEAGWHLLARDLKTQQQADFQFDYLVNACGFKSGEIDDLLAFKRQRWVEFKAAYVARWESCQGHWPEIIFHGERGTPRGMAQLTPYAEGYFQLHGMTPAITLFNNGLVTSNDQSSQPQLNHAFLQKIEHQWPVDVMEQRTHRSIQHTARFIPAFTNAEIASKPLFGAQQIPGNDTTLRAADVSFQGERYARAEIVKASSALTAADQIINQLVSQDLIENSPLQGQHLKHPITSSFSEASVENLAMSLAKQRGYPPALAKAVDGRRTSEEPYSNQTLKRKEGAVARSV